MWTVVWYCVVLLKTHLPGEGGGKNLAFDKRHYAEREANPKSHLTLACGLQLCTAERGGGAQRAVPRPGAQQAQRGDLVPLPVPVLPPRQLAGGAAHVRGGRGQRPRPPGVVEGESQRKRSLIATKIFATAVFCLGYGSYEESSGKTDSPNEIEWFYLMETKNNMGDSWKKNLRHVLDFIPNFKMTVFLS